MWKEKDATEVLICCWRVEMHGECQFFFTSSEYCWPHFFAPAFFICFFNNSRENPENLSSSRFEHCADITLSCWSFFRASPSFSISCVLRYVVSFGLLKAKVID